MTKSSDSESKNSGNKDVVNVSCWNCFIVENDNDHEKELPLPKVRKDNRQKFKLYSVLASEISRPKAVPIKQKVKANYAVGKKIEKQIINHEVAKANNEKEDTGTNIEIPKNNPKSSSHIDFTEDIVEQETSVSPDSLENSDNEPVIVHKVQIENSTPKKPKNIDYKECNCSPVATEEEKPMGEDVENLPSPQNTSSIIEADNVIINDKMDNTSSTYSESGYEGSSIHDSNDIQTSKIYISQKSVDFSSSYSPISIKRLSNINCNQQDFKNSLPALNVSQRRQILKSTRTLYGETSESETKPMKSLRWSTFDLPYSHKSTSTDDDVYLSDPPQPNHATLPRRSNSPLPHERDLLDRDRFSLNRSGLQARSESMASVYSGAGEGTRGSVTVRGEVQISLLYNYRLGALEVGVKRCRELAPVDIKRNRSDPYVKVYLLPDKSKAGKRKTKVKKNTLNPVFEETLSFVQPLASLSARTLWLSVWHADMFGRNDFLGEVTLPLADVVFDDPAPMWYKLHERTEQLEEVAGSRGDVVVALKLELQHAPPSAKAKATLHVLVKEAKNLVAAKPNGLADVFCKSYLLPERGRLAKQKTAVCRRTLNPKWEHTFTYRGLTLQELSSRALELSLWDRDRLASNDFMGAIRLSLGTGTYMGASVNWMDSVGKEVTLWQKMMQRPNFWVEGSFPLRPHLNN